VVTLDGAGRPAVLKMEGQVTKRNINTEQSFELPLDYN